MVARSIMATRLRAFADYNNVVFGCIHLYAFDSHCRLDWSNHFAHGLVNRDIPTLARLIFLQEE
jgi:hypothetical protein